MGISGSIPRADSPPIWCPPRLDARKTHPRDDAMRGGVSWQRLRVLDWRATLEPYLARIILVQNAIRANGQLRIVGPPLWIDPVVRLCQKLAATSGLVRASPRFEDIAAIDATRIDDAQPVRLGVSIAM